jgi:hypothetical protein
VVGTEEATQHLSSLLPPWAGVSQLLNKNSRLNSDFSRFVHVDVPELKAHALEKSKRAVKVRLFTFFWAYIIMIS